MVFFKWVLGGVVLIILAWLFFGWFDSNSTGLESINVFAPIFFGTLIILPLSIIFGVMAQFKKHQIDSGGKDYLGIKVNNIISLIVLLTLFIFFIIVIWPQLRLFFFHP